MSFSLIRNSRVFFTTNVNATTGVIAATGALPANTREIQVLDGFSFSQNTGTETVTLNEAGATPVRGQRSFNTSLEPVDFSFTTYIRPNGAPTNVTAEESVLWNAMFAKDPIGGALPAWVEGVSSAVCSVTNSNIHQLQAFGLVVYIDGSIFLLDDCVMDSATIDFGLDAIAAIQWSGKAKAIRVSTNAYTLAGTTTVTITGSDFAGTATGKVETAPYLANKLSVLAIDKTIDGGGTSFNVALTGGSITISNNVSYLTPQNLGVVNKPATYFTGTRAISGTLNAYLRSNASGTNALLSDVLAGGVEPSYEISIHIGGSATAPTRVTLNMPAVMLSIPTVATEQVVSTTIGFTAQGYTGENFDISQSNELTVTYVAP